MKIPSANKKFIFLLLAGPCLALASGSSDLCSDLASFSCAPGEFNDGTGVAENGMFRDDGAKTDLSISVSNDLEKKFGEVLANPENSYFRSLAIDGLGLRSAPDCQSKESDAIERCNKNLNIGLTAIAKHSLMEDAKGQAGTGNTNPRVAHFLQGLSQIVNNAQYVDIVRAVSKNMDKKLTDPAVEKNIRENMFPKLKSLLVARIERLPIDDTKRQFMMAKVQAIEFAGTDCNEDVKSLERNFIANAFYNPERNSLKICRGLLQGNVSDFHVAGVLLHELAHSIDPCNLPRGPGSTVVKHSDTKNLKKMDSEYVLPNLISCLRSEKSVRAKNPLFEMVSQHRNSKPDPLAPLPAAVTPLGNYSHCKDQIGESTADWFSSEVIADYIQQAHPSLTTEQWRVGASNMFRPLCKFTDGGMFENHPPWFDRINAVFLQNPKLRGKMKCGADPQHVYCDGMTAPEALGGTVTGSRTTQPAPQAAPKPTGSGQVVQ